MMMRLRKNRNNRLVGRPPFIIAVLLHFCLLFRNTSSCGNAAFVVVSPKVKVLGGSNNSMRTIITSSRNPPLSLFMSKNSNNEEEEEESDQTNKNNDPTSSDKGSSKDNNNKDDDLSWRITKLRLEEANTRQILSRKPLKLPYAQSQKWIQLNFGPKTQEEFEQLVMDGDIKNVY